MSALELPLEWEEPEPPPPIVGRWQDHAACRGMDPDVFFPGQGDPVHTPLAICFGCPVRAPCLDEHMDEAYGIWGGTTEDERKTMRRGAGRKVRKLMATCAWCTDPFVARGPQHLYCTPECRRRAKLERLTIPPEGAA